MELISGIPTKNIKKILSFALLLITIFASTYCILITLTDTFLINTDSLAPFDQYKLISSGSGNGLLDVHLARIPSLFPDLAITATIHQLLPNNGNLDNLSSYVWLKLFVLLLATTGLSLSLKQGSRSATEEAAKIGLIIFALANSSPIARQALGQSVMPAHHGGNAINTMLLFILIIKLIEWPKKFIYTAPCFLLTVFAVISNKIFLFTGVGPAIIVLLLIFKATRKSAVLITGLVFACCIGMVLDSLLNTQCSPELSINLLNSFQSIHAYLILSWLPISATLLALLSFILVIGDILEGKGPHLNKKAGVALISLSTLSFYVYVPLIAGSLGSNMRYLVTLYCLTPILFCLYLEIIFKRNHIYSLLISILAAALSFLSPLKSSIRTYAFWPKQLLSTYVHEHQKPFIAATRFLKSNGYDTYAGFGDFWSSGITMLSNSKINITPINSSGEGDFWATSPQTVKNNLKNTNESKVYIFSINRQFSDKLIRNFGTPEKDWHYNQKMNTFQDSNLEYNSMSTYRINLSDARILLFEGNAISKKVLNSASRFKRQCNRDLPNFKER